MSAPSGSSNSSGFDELDVFFEAMEPGVGVGFVFCLEGPFVLASRRIGT